QLCNLALIVITLPHSNADVEHVLSQFNVIKNELRNRLSLCTVNSILHIRYGLQAAGRKCYEYSLLTTLARWRQPRSEEEEPPLDEAVLQALL
ncbi:UNVERIFIED_CONTAM: hypothetical protein FKN15_004625, partial [Acipenser sinensis]